MAKADWPEPETTLVPPRLTHLPGHDHLFVPQHSRIQDQIDAIDTMLPVRPATSLAGCCIRC